MSRHHILQISLAALVSLILAPDPSRAQDEPGRAFSDSVRVELVNVEVWVTDESGAPVGGLAREEFQLLHDGSPVPVSHFAEIRGGRPTSPQAASAGAEAGADSSPSPTYLVVLFDQPHLSVGSLKSLVRQVRELLAEGRFPSERVLILRLEHRISVEAPFGSRAEDLESALRRVEDAAGASTRAAAEVKQTVQALQSVWNDLQSLAASRSLRSVVDETRGTTASQGAAAPSGSASGPGSAGTAGGPSSRACDDYVDRVGPIVDQWAQRERERTSQALGRLADVASFLSGVPGLKVLLYASDGLTMQPGLAATSFVRGLCPAFQTDLEVDLVAESMEEQLLAVTHTANSNRVTIYSVQGSGLGGSLVGSGSRASGDSRGIRGFERSQAGDARASLTLLAENTGGRPVLGSSDLGDQLDRMADEISSYYSLAYTPPPSEGSRVHSIEVRLANDSLEVRHRESYGEKTTDQWLTERLESALYLGQVDNPLEVRLAAAASTPGEQDLYTLPLHVIVPAERLTFAELQELPMARLVVKVMALNTTDQSLSISNRRMFLPRPGDGAGQTLDLSLPIELRPGLHVVVVAVLDVISRDASIVSATIAVGPPEDPN